MKPQRARVDFGGRAARRRLLAEMAAAKPARQGIRPPRATVALVIFLAILSAALHGGAVRGSFANGPGFVGGGSLRAAGPKGPSREVDDMRARRWMAAALVGLTATASAHGADRLVPSKEYPTIQSAIDAAQDGDIIRLSSGSFVERVTVRGKAIVIRGAGSDSTYWHAPQGMGCLLVPDEESIPFELSDLTVSKSGSTYSHAVVSLRGVGKKTVERCVFSDNSGWASLEVFGDNSVVQDCRFERNGMGASIAHGLNMTLRRCIFTGNSQDNSAGGGPWVPADIDFYACSFQATDCTFAGSSSLGGAAVRVVAGGRFTRCQFAQLNGGAASAVHSYNGDSVSRFQFCSFCECPEPRFAGSGQFIDEGGSVVSQTCAPPCPADIVRDNAVNGADLAIILVAWGTNGSQYPGADLDGDGVVNGSDLATVLAAWGPCPH
jgi:hypothetical protein